MNFKITNKTTLRSPDKRVIIYDFRGIIFYDSSWAKNFKGIFTLPRGTYNSSNTLRKGNKRKNSFHPVLPDYERDLKHDFSKFSIFFKPNPNKCTINHDKKTITFDSNYLDAPWFQLVFILLHEKGHNYYNSEDKADLYAVRGMLKRGYTPIQIILSPLLTLSGKQYDRKKKVIRRMIKHYKYSKKNE